MHIISRIFKSQWLLLIFLGCYLGFALLTFTNYGITTDEPYDYALGKQLYIYFRGHDPVIESFLSGKNQDDPVELHHNHIYPALLYALNGSESFESYHLLNFIFASILFICAYQLLLAETRMPGLAIFGPLFLVLTPVLFGHIPFNPKDIPFAWSFLLSLTLIYFLVKKKQWWIIPILGVSFGLTQSLRSIGFLIYPIFMLFWLLENRPLKQKKLTVAILKVGLIALIGTSLQLLSHPYLLTDPVHRFPQLLLGASAFDWQGYMLVFDQKVLAQDLPIWYVPLWILITTPILFLLLAGTSWLVVRQTKLFRLLAISLGSTLLLVIATKPVVYDGLRHFLFVVPQLSILAVLTFAYVLKNWRGWKRIAIIYLFVVQVLIISKHSVQFFPYQYVYFNELLGGVAGAAGQFELDYWGASYKEGAEWLNEQPWSLNRPMKVYVCGDDTQAAYFFAPHLTVTTSLNEADVALCTPRDRDYEWLHQHTQQIYAVRRSLVPILFIFHLNQPQ